MTDTLPGLFRSALNFINNQGIPAVSRVVSATTSAVSGITGEHPLVGQVLEVGQYRVKIQALLAEGGFALVFSCQSQDGKWYALKRQIATDAQSAAAIQQEIQFAKELSGHPAIMRFISASQHKTQDGRVEYYMLSELCSGGPLIEVMQRTKLKSDQVLKIFYALCHSVHHMHDRNPPITHRDLKIENLLFDAKSRIKLCDFGSATTDVFRPDDTWSVLQRTLLEEEMQRFTTPMYRAPEILDTYQNYPIGPSQDVWALGCILIYLCYGRHPFEDSAKLAIVNANYRLPKTETPFAIFHPIIESLLQPDPYSRPMISDVIERLEAIAVVLGVRPTDPVTGLNPTAEERSSSPSATRSPPSNAQLPVPPQPQTIPTQMQASSPTPVSSKTPPPKPPPPRRLPTAQPPLQDSAKAQPLPRTTSIQQSEEERIHAHNEESNRRAAEDHRRAMVEEEEYRRALAKEERTLRETRDRKEALPPSELADNDLFAIFDSRPQPSASSVNLKPLNDDLLGDWPCDSAQMHRNASAPTLEDKNGKKFDPFADFLASTVTKTEPKQPNTQAKSVSDSSGSIPSNVQRFASSASSQTQKNPAGFSSNCGSSTGVGPKFGESAFDDLLSSHGFSSTAKNAQRSLASIRREEEVKVMDPIKIKIRDWTEGKERNIRALLSSLNEVLWEDAVYTPPSMADLISDSKIKKCYMKAVVVIHPDKQRNQPHEALAKAIFTELSSAYKKFESERIQ